MTERLKNYEGNVIQIWTARDWKWKSLARLMDYIKPVYRPAKYIRYNNYVEVFICPDTNPVEIKKSLPFHANESVEYSIQFRCGND